MAHTNHSPKFISTIGLLLLSWCLCQKKCEPGPKGRENKNQQAGKNNPKSDQKEDKAHDSNKDKGNKTGLDDITLKFAKESVDESLKQLLELIEKGDEAKIKESINKKNEDGEAPIHQIVESGSSYRPEILRCFLKNGANPALTNNEGDTALHLVLRENAISYVKEQNVLLGSSNSQSFDVANEQGMTPLMEAARKEHGAAIKKMLKKADVSKVDNKKRNILHHLLMKHKDWHDSKDVLEATLENKKVNWAVLTAKDNQRRMPVHIALESGVGPELTSNKIFAFCKIIDAMIEQLPPGMSVDKLRNLIGYSAASDVFTFFSLHNGDYHSQGDYSKIYMAIHKLEQAAKNNT